MNPNDIIAQQQAILNQLAQQTPKTMWGVLVIQIVILILTGWVVCMFYARLRDIANELRNVRISLEASQGPGTMTASDTPQERGLHPDDSRYMPKP